MLHLRKRSRAIRRLLGEIDSTPPTLLLDSVDEIPEGAVDFGQLPIDLRKFYTVCLRRLTEHARCVRMLKEEPFRVDLQQRVAVLLYEYEFAHDLFREEVTLQYGEAVGARRGSCQVVKGLRLCFIESSPQGRKESKEGGSSIQQRVNTAKRAGIYIEPRGTDPERVH